jgi:lysine-specific demethylase/histidyl-hydroxylase NO66
MLPAAVQAAMDEDVEFRRSLPVDYPLHVGGVNSETDSPQRKAFFNQLGGLVSKLMYYAPVDATADQRYLDTLEESLPPVLSEGPHRFILFPFFFFVFFFFPLF